MGDRSFGGDELNVHERKKVLLNAVSFVDLPSLTQMECREEVLFNIGSLRVKSCDWLSLCYCRRSAASSHQVVLRVSGRAHFARGECRMWRGLRYRRAVVPTPRGRVECRNKQERERVGKTACVSLVLL